MRIVTSAQRLALAPHVRACVSDGQVILLDLRNSAYLGIDGARCDALAGRVEGWPGNPNSANRCTAFEAADPTLLKLLERGLLTDAPSKQPPQASVEEVTSSLDAEDGSASAGIGPRRLARFLWSAMETTVWMHCRSLQAIATAVQARRERRQSSSPACSLESVRAGTAAYERLRPFAFSTHKNCLHDSLALVGFLASEDAFPRWVIGVKTRPFAAHSWVQLGATVLNDQHETVRQFRPILVV